MIAYENNERLLLSNPCASRFIQKHAGFAGACRNGRALPGGGKRQPLCRQTESRQTGFSLAETQFGWQSDGLLIAC
ncbi:MAG: hypothetical protein ACKOAO_03330 [Oxalobacteraceae bacterium]